MRERGLLMRSRRLRHEGRKSGAVGLRGSHGAELNLAVGLRACANPIKTYQRKAKLKIKRKTQN